MICFCLYLCGIFWGNKCFHLFIRKQIATTNTCNSSRREERLKRQDWPCRMRPCRAHFHASTVSFPVHRFQHCMIQTLRCLHDRLTGRRYVRDDLSQADSNTSERSSLDLTIAP